MLSNPNKLRLYVESRRVPIGTTTFSRQTAVGPLTYTQSSEVAVLYGHVLDDSQTKLVEEARRLSCSAGLDLEVVDLGKMNAIRRALVSRFVSQGLTVLAADEFPASASK